MCPPAPLPPARQHRWWAAGYAVLPQPYRAAWASESLPSELAAAAGLTDGLLLGALDEGLSAVRAPDLLEPIAQHVAELFAERVHRRPRSELARLRIAPGPWPEGLDPRHLPFSLRTRNMLDRHGRLDDTAWLATASAADLGALRLCGPLTVLEVAALLERHLGTAACGSSQAHLELALAEVVRAVVAEGNVERMLRRFGWDGRGGRTLQAVAAEAGVTRERIRQIESALLNRLHAGTDLPALDRAIGVLDDAVRRAPHADGVGVLLDAGVTATEFLPRGVLKAASVFCRPTQFEVDPDGRTVRRPIPGELAAAMVEALLDVQRRIGAVVSVREFLAAVEARGGATDAERARQFLASRQRLEWLDCDRTWFWIRQASGRNQLEHMIRKVISVGGSIPTEALGAALARNPRLWPRPIPAEAIEGLCRLAGLCVRDGVVSSSVPIDPAAVLSPTEFVLVKQLRGCGGSLPAHELRGSTDIAPGTLSSLLAQSPLLERGPGDRVRLVSSRGPRSPAQPAPAAHAPTLS